MTAAAMLRELRASGAGQQKAQRQALQQGFWGQSLRNERRSFAAVQSSVVQDIYGFTIRPQFVEEYRKYATLYQEEEAERSEKWDKFLQHYSRPFDLPPSPDGLQASPKLQAAFEAIQASVDARAEASPRAKAAPLLPGSKEALLENPTQASSVALRSPSAWGLGRALVVELHANGDNSAAPPSSHADKPLYPASDGPLYSPSSSTLKTSTFTRSTSFKSPMLSPVTARLPPGRLAAALPTPSPPPRPADVEVSKSWSKIRPSLWPVEKALGKRVGHARSASLSSAEQGPELGSSSDAVLSRARSTGSAPLEAAALSAGAALLGSPAQEERADAVAGIEEPLEAVGGPTGGTIHDARAPAGDECAVVAGESGPAREDGSIADRSKDAGSPSSGGDDLGDPAAPPAALEEERREAGDKVQVEWDEELRSLVRIGVPMALRGELWQVFVRTKWRRRPGHYEALLQQVTEPKPGAAEAEDEFECGTYSSHYLSGKDEKHKVLEKWTIQIEKDLPRTFPGHPALDSIGRSALRRILTAYARHNPAVGYCQGMNFLAGLLLLLMPEENAFWTLCGIVEDYLDGYYSELMIEAQVDQLVFDELVRKHFPRVAHLDALGVQVAWVSGPWFLSVFVNILPWESVLRLWDVLLYEGNRCMLFRTALALLELHAPKLIATNDPGDCVAMLQSIAGATFDSSHIVYSACMGYSFITEELLEEMRARHRLTVLQQIEERMASLAKYQSMHAARLAAEAKAEAELMGNLKDMVDMDGGEENPSEEAYYSDNDEQSSRSQSVGLDTREEEVEDTASGPSSLPRSRSRRRTGTTTPPNRAVSIPRSHSVVSVDRATGSERDEESDTEDLQAQACCAPPRQPILMDLGKIDMEIKWMKEQMVTAVEGRNEAASRAEELQAALLEFAASDNRLALSAQVENLEKEVEHLTGRLSAREEQLEAATKRVDALEGELETQKELRSVAENDALAQRQVVNILQEKYESALDAQAELQERVLMAESMLHACAASEGATSFGGSPRTPAGAMATPGSVATPSTARTSIFPRSFSWSTARGSAGKKVPAAVTPNTPTSTAMPWLEEEEVHKSPAIFQEHERGEVEVKAIPALLPKSPLSRSAPPAVLADMAEVGNSDPAADQEVAELEAALSMQVLDKREDKALPRPALSAEEGSGGTTSASSETTMSDKSPLSPAQTSPSFQTPRRTLSSKTLPAFQKSASARQQQQQLANGHHTPESGDG
eukprot:SM000073S21446  [mRNA]  locus=s73:319050:324962:- [translate_table: standard]